MNELLQAAVSPANIIPTALLAFVLMYWGVVILGAIDVDFFDIDVDLETDADLDGEVSISWLNHALAFFNLGQIPLMLFLTFWIIPVWSISVLGNDYLNNTSLLFSLLLLIPIGIASLFVAKFLTIPFVRVYKALDQEDNTTPVGKICRVISAANNRKVGQAKIQTKGAPLLLNIKTYEGFSLDPNDTAIVIEYSTEQKVYLVEPYIA